MQSGRLDVRWSKVVCFGDSLTQYGYSRDGCWVSILTDNLQRKCDVLNRGFSGYNSRWCDIILPRLVTKDNAQEIAAFILFLGANDSNLPESKQHVPCNDYSKHMTSMLQYLNTIGVSSEKVIVINMPPCDETKWQAACKELGYPMLQDNKYKQQYAIACRHVASHHGCLFVDAYMSFMQQQDWKEMFHDGLHFSTKGAEFLASLVWPHVQKLTDSLPTNLPLWSNVDHEHPEKSFISNE